MVAGVIAKGLNKLLGKKPVKRKPRGSTVKKVAPKKVTPKRVRRTREQIASTRLKNRESIDNKVYKATPAKRKKVFKKLTGTKDYKKSEKDFKKLTKAIPAVKPRRISFNKSKATLLGTAALGTAAGYALGSRNKKSSGDKVVPIQRGGAANKGNKGNKGNKVPGASSSEYLTRTPRPNFSATNVKKKPKSTKRLGPGRPTMTSMVAKPPKPRNKNVTRRPKRPSKQGSFGR